MGFKSSNLFCNQDMLKRANYYIRSLALRLDALLGTQQNSFWLTWPNLLVLQLLNMEMSPRNLCLSTDLKTDVLINLYSLEILFLSEYYKL